jgi:hypothetical protein
VQAMPALHTKNILFYFVHNPYFLEVVGNSFSCPTISNF